MFVAPKCWRRPPDRDCGVPGAPGVATAVAATQGQLGQISTMAIMSQAQINGNNSNLSNVNALAIVPMSGAVRLPSTGMISNINTFQNQSQLSMNLTSQEIQQKIALTNNELQV